MPNINLSYSAELITNYLQAELISPQKKFEALQAANGHSLLFSIGADGTFYLFREESGKSAAGWSKTGLSSRQIQKDYPGQSSAGCRTFEVGQSKADGSIGMAMAVNTGSGDRLYLCLKNSNEDLSWADSPDWKIYDYDNPNVKMPTLDIANVYFCEIGSDDTQYVFVDVVRDPESNVKNIRRFYIDPLKSSGYYWNEHDLPVDIEAEHYDSCTGRLPANDWPIDGVYTAGRAGSSGQLVYTPVINVNGDGPPTSVRLQLPGNAIPGAIASTRNPNLTSNLFAVGNDSLYYFASTNQEDQASGASLMRSDIFTGTHKLSAMEHNGVITLWGLNGSDQVYYTSCQATRVADPSAWSAPLPILSGIEEMSPFINLLDGGNTIFAAGDGRLFRITQASHTSSKLWNTDQITLPAPPSQKSISFDSYTTTIHVADAQGLPMKGARLSIRANNRCSVYINGVYYLIDNNPVHIQSNSLGTITIVEAIDSLQGTQFTISADGAKSVTIDPSEEPFQKLASLDTPDKLKAAQINEENGKARPLVGSGASSQDMQTVAAALGKLGKRYSQLQPNAASAAVMAIRPEITMELSLDDIGDAIEVAAGDLFHWLKSGVEAVIHIIEDTATATWHFIAKIAGKVYRAVIDTIDAVVGAIVWVFKAIKTIVKDIIAFVKLLFEWDDIKRTKEVIHNLVKRFLEKQVGEIITIQDKFDHMIGSVESTVNKWAGITDWSGIGEPARKPATGSASNPMKGQTSRSQLLAHHFQNNARDISIAGGAPILNLLDSLIQDLLTALKNEAHVLEGVFDQLKQLAHDFSSLTVEQVLKRLAGILIDGVLSSVQAVVDAILKILADVANTLLDILDAKLHIPVISDILNAIGVPDISFLDLFCWISALAYTIVYKIAEDKAPFPDNAETNLLINATSMDQLQKAFGIEDTPLPAIRPMAEAELAENDIQLDEVAEAVPEVALETGHAHDVKILMINIHMSEEARKGVFVAGHSIGAFCTLISDFVATFEAAEESGDNSFSIPSAVLGIITAGAVGTANFLVPRAGIQNSVVKWAGTATTVVQILCKIIFSGPLQKKFGASEGVLKILAAEDGRATGAIVNSILVIPALFCTGWHFYELAEKTPSGHEKTDAILEETSNLASYISRVSYALAVNDKDEESRLIIIGIMAVANLAYAGLQTAEAVVD